jgi:hypothetical protein
VYARKIPLKKNSQDVSMHNIIENVTYRVWSSEITFYESSLISFCNEILNMLAKYHHGILQYIYYCDMMTEGRNSGARRDGTAVARQDLGKHLSAT